MSAPVSALPATPVCTPRPGMPQILVSNRHHGYTTGTIPAHTFYVGRGTPLGNPFEIGKHGDRLEVIEKYRQWLHRQLRVGDTPTKRELDRLASEAARHPIILLCSCAPAPCHAEVVLRAIFWRLGLEPPTPRVIAADPQLSLLG